MAAYNSSYTGAQVDNVVNNALLKSEASTTYLTQANAQNTYLTQTNATNLYEPKNFGIHLDLLWTNPNHAAAFSEQDVTVDVSSYKLVLVFFQEYAPASDRQEGRWELGVVERTNVQMRATVHFGTSSESEKNRGWKVTTTGVHFWSGWAGSGNNNNGQCVPWYIYGIK